MYCIPLEKGKFVTQNQRLFESEYEQSFFVGSGGFGRCAWVVQKTTRAERVAKIIDKERCAMPLEEIEQELDILRDLDHPHIVRCFEWFESGSEFVIVMEVARGGDFDKALKAAQKAGRRGLSEGMVSVLCQQGFGALAYIHSKKVIHRDLKPANIFMLKKDENPPHVLVADFGIADIFHFGAAAARLTESHKKGTWPYMAPEIFEDLVSPKSDVWAMGVVSWELLTGEKPFGVKPFEVHATVCDDDPIDFGPVAEAAATRGPDGAVAFLERLLVRDEAARLTAHEAQVAAERWAPPGGGCRSDHRGSMESLCVDLEESMDLQGLQDGGAFSKAAMLCMASQMDSSTIERLADRFDRIDADRDGRISVVEFAASFRELGYSEGDIETMVASLDVDHDGEVEYNEFVAGCIGADRHLQETALRAAFSVFDVDGDGSIQIEEFEQILGAEGSQSLLPDGMRIDQEFAKVDTSSDGRITYEEFKAFVEKLHREHASREAAGAGGPLGRLRARRQELAAETAQYKALHARVDGMNARLQELLAGR
ncbi:unnamed protein product [Prorocentrum cordatum]|nr:unnamed protein product [Polarella glacialis]